MSFDLFTSGLLQGLVLALVAYAVMIPFRLLNFADLTSEGAYPLGGAICSSLIIAGIYPIFAILIACFLAGIMGICTALVHLKLKVNTLLAGIIISTMAYSVNLRFLGKPNVALFNNASLFSTSGATIENITILASIIATIILLTFLFLKTEIGLKFRAVGLNQDFAKKSEISVEKYTMLGLFAAAFLSGLAGSLMVQLQQYMDVGMGIGILIHALAALMIGEALVSTSNMLRQFIAPLVGALIYQQIQGIALSAGLAPSDLKFFTGTIVLIVIGMNVTKRHHNSC